MDSMQKLRRMSDSLIAQDFSGCCAVVEVTDHAFDTLHADMGDDYDSEIARELVAIVAEQWRNANKDSLH